MISLHPAADLELAVVDALLSSRAVDADTLVLKGASPRPWDKFERDLSRALGSIISREASRIADQAEPTGTFAQADQLWKDFRFRLLQAFKSQFPIIVRTAVNDARKSSGTLGGKIDWKLTNKRAADWALQYSYELVKNLEDTSRQRLQEGFSSWVTDGTQDLAALRALVQAAVGDAKRAKVIATTETTRIYAEANAKAWEDVGVVPATYKPPAHPNCRCLIRPKQLRDKSWVMVWQTAVDEIVCVAPLKTPWGEVEGCKGMHNVILSQGPWMGRTLSRTK